MYQEDYFALLNATETGRRITYDPTNIVTYTEDFGEYVKNAVKEVRIYSLTPLPLPEEATTVLRDYNESTISIYKSARLRSSYVLHFNWAYFHVW